MLSKYLVGINWVDILIAGLIIRMCYIGIKTGVAVELFKLLGLWIATVATYHVYTTPLSDRLNERVPALPLNASDAFVFVALLTACILVARMVRESFFLLIKIEAHNTLDRWAGFAIGFLRGLWIASIALFIMTISTIQNLEISAKSSLMGHKLINFAPSVYKGTFESIVAPFLKNPKINEEVFKAIER